MATKIRPLQDRLIVKRVKEEEKTKGGIIIPDSAKEKPVEGEVIAVGNGKVQEDGSVRKPDVKKGDRIVGVYQPGNGARFFFNGASRGEIRDAAFAERFFAIWLGPRTSEPAMRAALLMPLRPASPADPP